ncbi:MAG TPA: acetate kinase [Planctomycetaceae bacterium]
MLLLVLNTGSSSLKYELFAAEGDDLASVADGLVERIGEAGGDVPDHAAALAKVFDRLERSGRIDPGRLGGIGHRVVHGGEAFDRPAAIDDRVLDEIRKATPLAPLHNPAAVAGIEAARRLRPDVPQVAVFDTAFHMTVPPHAHRYALPAWCYEKYGVRRYGFHGTSHAYVSRKAAEMLGRSVERTNVVTLHLGNGASVAAVAGGRCVETSMGLTPLEGLVMGTRSGDLDPAVPLFLCREAGMTPAEVDRLLNRESGLKGLCGENDMRAVIERAAAGDADAELALAVYCHRVRKYVGAYAAVLGRLDAVVFTAGVGENAAEVRRRVCEDLDLLGVRLDAAKNGSVRCGEAADVAAEGSRARVLVVPTDEEREIAAQTLRIVRGEA